MHNDNQATATMLREAVQSACGRIYVDIVEGTLGTSPGGLFSYREGSDIVCCARLAQQPCAVPFARVKVGG